VVLEITEGNVEDREEEELKDRGVADSKKSLS